MRWSVLLLLLAPLAWGDDSKKRPTDEQRGKELYERHCVACHGATAKGDGPATAALVVPIPDLQGQVETDKPTVELVQFGRGAMPAYEASFDAEDTKRVLKYMANVHQKPPPKPGPPAPGAPAPGAPAPAAPAPDAPAPAATVPPPPDEGEGDAAGPR